MCCACADLQRLLATSCQLQHKLCFKVCQRDETSNMWQCCEDESPISDSLFVPFAPPILVEWSQLGKGINEKDGRDAEQQIEPRLGASICEEKGDATRRQAGRQEHPGNSFSFYESPAPGKTHLNMANFSRYIRLLIPARWHLVEVPVAGRGCSPTLAPCQSSG